MTITLSNHANLLDSLTLYATVKKAGEEAVEHRYVGNVKTVLCALAYDVLSAERAEKVISFHTSFSTRHFFDVTRIPSSFLDTIKWEAAKEGATVSVRDGEAPVTRSPVDRRVAVVASTNRLETTLLMGMGWHDALFLAAVVEGREAELWIHTGPVRDVLDAVASACLSTKASPCALVYYAFPDPAAYLASIKSAVRDSGRTLTTYRTLGATK